MAVFGNLGAFGAIKANGSVVTWGDDDCGVNSSAVAPLLTEGVVQVYGNDGAFAAIKANGSVVTWGDDDFGGNSSAVAPLLTEGVVQGVVQVCGTDNAFAAIKANGSVVTWGNPHFGGNSSAVAPLLTEGVVQVCGNDGAFAAIMSNGSVVTWGPDNCGGNSSAVAPLLTEGIVQVCGNRSAFAAIKANGSVVTWGDDDCGGNSSAASHSAFTTDYALTIRTAFDKYYTIPFYRTISIHDAFAEHEANTYNNAYASMFIFVFMWTPALTEEGKPKPPYGHIFAAFMVMSMLGSQVFSILSASRSVEEVGRLAMAAAAACHMIPVFSSDATIRFLSFLGFELCVGV
ncbi:unnamed protein product, partial [Polarella glacialis]